MDITLQLSTNGLSLFTNYLLIGLCCNCDFVQDNQELFIYYYFTCNSSSIILGIAAFFYDEGYLYIYFYIILGLSFICSIISIIRCCKNQNACSDICKPEFLKIAKYPLIHSYVCVTSKCEEAIELFSCIMILGIGIIFMAGTFLGFYTFFLIFLFFWLLCKMFSSLGNAFDDCCSNSNKKNKGNNSLDKVDENLLTKYKISAAFIATYEERIFVIDGKIINNVDVEI